MTLPNNNKISLSDLWVQHRSLLERFKQIRDIWIPYHVQSEEFTDAEWKSFSIQFIKDVRKLFNIYVPVEPKEDAQ